MAEMKHTTKTAESGGIQNVGPNTTVDTALRQAAATVPGSEAAATQAMPSDGAVKEYLKTHPAGRKTFRDTVQEREADRAAGIEPNNEAYPSAPRDGLKPSKKTEGEMSRGADAVGDAAHQQGDIPLSDPASRAAAEYNRNKAAEQQVERVLGVEEAPPDLKARPSEPPGVDTTASGGQVPEQPHSGERAVAEEKKSKK